MNRFENKIIIITGAAGGIGASTTRRIVSEGGKVVIADYSREKADQFAAELSNSGADVRPVYFSATELKSCKELITFTMKEYGQIDVLVNNVGGTNPRRDTNIETLDMDYFDEAFHLNLSCTMYLSQLVPHYERTRWWKYCKRSLNKWNHGRFEWYSLWSQQSRSHQSDQIHCHPNGKEKHPLQCSSTGIDPDPGRTE